MTKSKSKSKQKSSKSKLKLKGTRGPPPPRISFDEVQSRLVRFYEKRAPEKLENPQMLDKIVERVAGNEQHVDALFAKLQQKYPKKLKTTNDSTKAATTVEEYIPPLLRPVEFDQDHSQTQSSDGMTTVNLNTSNAHDHKSAKSHVSNNSPSQKTGVLRRFRNGVEYLDSHCGNGIMVARHRQVTVKYVGYLIEEDKTKGPLFDRGTLTFKVGCGEVVKGLDDGLKNMREGGKRNLLIPSALGYGSRGAGPSIPADTDLMFKVEVVRVGSRREQVRKEKAKTRKRAARRGGGAGRRPQKQQKQRSIRPCVGLF